jgi:Cu/Ag efflux pump CusA
MTEFEGGETLEKRKLELAFIDRNGKIYPIDEVSRAELAEGLEKISRETAKRLLLVKEQR